MNFETFPFFPTLFDNKDDGVFRLLLLIKIIQTKRGNIACHKRFMLREHKDQFLNDYFLPWQPQYNTDIWISCLVLHAFPIRRKQLNTETFELLITLQQVNQDTLKIEDVGDITDNKDENSVDDPDTVVTTEESASEPTNCEDEE